MRDMRCLIVILIFIYPGRICSMSNVALQRPVWEDSPWMGREDWRATKAVDGRYNDRSAAGGQCVISEHERKTATWRVDLGDVVSISHINIYYRTDNFPIPTGYTARMAGFFLYVSNTTSKYDGHLCFHEIQTVNRTPSEDQRINCSVHGRYVIYYNERRENVTYPSYYSKFAHYELCELEVYGCRDYRRYGDNCVLWCPPNCQERRCDIVTGHCLGCIPGYQGMNCSLDCGAHTYGLECGSICGNCSRGDACNHVNGRCPRGCDGGVQGEKCQDECKLGQYGENCRNLCNENCNVTSRCDRFTGSCIGGCKPGYTGNTCDQKCDTGKYGKNCLQNCAHCKQRDQCHHIDGVCVEGCSAGYYGSRCIEPCQSGLFGLNCINRCDSYCIGNGSCDPVTGICNEGCKKGWSGLMCGSDGLSNQHSCGDSTPIAIGVALSVVIVLVGSVINFIYWRRKTAINEHTRRNNYEATADNEDKSGNVSQQYTELGEVTKASNYDELHNYVSVK